jgi:SH3-like domain-containing protein
MLKMNRLYIILIISLFFSFEISIAGESFQFLSLKNSEVNLRQGPSFEYPVKLKYKKKHLPVIIIDKSDTWRKIKDFENNSGWIHTSQLSKKKSAINIKNNSVIYKKPTLYSKPIARLEIGRLIIIKKCENKWCKIITGDISGWVLKNTLWGMV